MPTFRAGESGQSIGTAAMSCNVMARLSDFTLTLRGALGTITSVRTSCRTHTQDTTSKLNYRPTLRTITWYVYTTVHGADVIVTRYDG